ncbi:MAG: DUF374 domain-containing protein [Verrucomicrobia bacterium]|nr:MAG: DUF374 domain-containing protein [Verrucomicrobiota bacterium]
MNGAASQKRSRTGPGVVVPHRATWRGRLLARLIYSAVRVVDWTLRYQLQDAEQARRYLANHPAIFVIWHNRLALSLMVYRRYMRQVAPGRRLAALVSASRDGGMLARVLELFGVRPVRGSSSRRGAQALLEMTSMAEQGFDLAVTPDGPRGPRYRLQPGVVGLAAATGFAVVPVSYQLDWKLQTRSWDRFQIPAPFGRVRVFIGEPVFVPPELDDAERERFRQEIEQRLRAITHD